MNKHWKKATAWILCMILVVTCIPAVTFAETASSTVNTTSSIEGDFAGGNGTAEDPYIIKTESHLDNIRNNLDGYYELANDIELTVENWAPVGADQEAPFQGSLDGNGYSIKGLQINADAKDTIYLGFIGCNSGQISNLEFEDCHLKYNISNTDNYYQGVISGFNDNTAVISNCKVSRAAVEHTSVRGVLYAGGVTGYNDGAISKTSFTGTVSGDHTIYAKVNIGGIAGRNTDTGIIEKSYSCMDLTSHQNLTTMKMSYWGGLCGYNAGTIRDSFCTGNLQVVSDIKSAGKAYLGAITGMLDGDAVLENVYQYADISGAYTKKGNIYGIGESKAYVVNAFYVDSNNLTRNTGTPLKTAEMEHELSYYGFDFESVWCINNEDSYKFPQLKDLPFEGVILQNSMADCNISLADAVVYSGILLEPEVTVSYGNTVLKADYDYILEYKDNMQVGTAMVQIRGLGHYYGERSVSFEIHPADISGYEVVLGNREYTYTGKAIKPTITLAGLETGKDFSVTYTDNVYPGTGRVYITGKGNYKGSLIAEFSIKEPQVPALTVLKGSLYNKYNTIRVSWTNINGETGYQVMYKKAAAKKWNVKRVTGSYATLSKLTGGAKYTIKVVPYMKVKGKFYEGKGKSATVYTLKKVNKPAVKKSSAAKVRVSWTNINGETGYQISRSAKKNGTNIVATFKTTTGKSRLIKAQKGKTYYYKVRAYKNITVNGVTKKVCGPWSNTYKFKNK